MKIAKPKIAAWSFSRWTTYMLCPLKAKFAFVDKIKEPGNAAMDRGSQIHKLAENFILRGGKIAPELKLISKTLKTYRKHHALTERELAFSSKWACVDWFAPDAWLRVKMDAFVPGEFNDGTALNADWKTGRKHEIEQYEPQLSLYAMTTLMYDETAERVKSEIVFVDHGDIVESPEIIERKDLKSLQKDWVGMTKKMLSDTTFKPTPGNHCRWCYFRKSNGGPCRY